MTRAMMRCFRAAALLAAALVLAEASSGEGGEDGISPADAEKMKTMLGSLPREEQLKMKRELEEMVGQGGRAEGERPPPVELPVDTARALTEALVAALRSKKAQKAMEKALAGSDEALSPADRSEALAPVLEKFSRPVLKRYDFSGGFQEALDSAKAVMRSTRDMDLAAAFEELGELVTGQQSPLREGRVGELDKIARGFLAMPDVDRRAALAEAEQAVGKFGSAMHPASEQYLKAMKGVLDSSRDDFIEDRVVQLARELQDNSETLGAEGVQALRAQLNVLSQFLAPEGHARVRSRLSGGQAGTGGGESGGKIPPRPRRRRKAKNKDGEL